MIRATLSLLPNISIFALQPVREHLLSIKKTGPNAFLSFDGKTQECFFTPDNFILALLWNTE